MSTPQSPYSNSSSITTQNSFLNSWALPNSYVFMLDIINIANYPWLGRPWTLEDAAIFLNQYKFLTAF